MSKVLRVTIFYLPIFALLALWELLGRFGLLDPTLFPSLGAVLKYREDAERVRDAGICELITAATKRAG